MDRQSHEPAKGGRKVESQCAQQQNTLCQHDAEYEAKQERVGDERERASESSYMRNVVRDDSQTGAPSTRFSKEHDTDGNEAAEPKNGHQGDWSIEESNLVDQTEDVFGSVALLWNSSNPTPQTGQSIHILQKGNPVENQWKGEYDTKACDFLPSLLGVVLENCKQHKVEHYPADEQDIDPDGNL